MSTPTTLDEMSIVAFKGLLPIISMEGLFIKKEDILQFSNDIQNKIDLLKDKEHTAEEFITVRQEIDRLGRRKHRLNAFLREIKAEVRRRTSIQQVKSNDLDRFLITFYNLARRRLDEKQVNMVIEETMQRIQNESTTQREKEDIEIFSQSMA